MVNRKLIRPSLTGVRDPETKQGQGPRASRKRVPPEHTAAEEYYYLKQMANRTGMVVHLIDGEQIRGIIEWYDRRCIKVNRDDAPNLLIPKRVIKYIYKQEEEDG